MALGGGVFIGQNKTLPGSYINFVSLSRIGAALSERGAAAFALELDWGPEDEVFVVTNEDFVKNSLGLFGYDYSHRQMRGLRELFRNAKTLYAFRLGGKDAAKAQCEFATAKFGGERGNDLSLVIVRESDSNMFTVKLLLDGIEVDRQTVSSVQALRDNDFVVWNLDKALTETAGMPFFGGGNVTATVAHYQRFLEKIESCPVNTIGVCSEIEAVNKMVAEFTVNMRDNNGVKIQSVVFNHAADHEGVVNVKNAVADSGARAGLCYWVTGIIAGCAINRSNLNRVYDGEFDVVADYAQRELESAIKAGEFVLHKVGNGLRVLADINSLVTVSDEKGEVFKDNQTVRVVDQIAGDIAALFNAKYLGSVANDDSGRISLWADIVKHHEDLQRIRAIEEFSDEDVEVLPGDDKRSVVVKDRINIVNAMAQVYMTCVIA